MSNMIKPLPDYIEEGSTNPQSNNNPTAPRMVQASMRELEALRLRATGMPYHKIGDAMGVSSRTAWESVQRAMVRIWDEVKEEAIHTRSLELQRLDEMFTGFFEAATKEQDTKAAEICLRIMDRRSRYLGLDKNEWPAGSDGKPTAPGAITGLNPADMTDEQLEEAEVAIAKLRQLASGGGGTTA